MLDWFNTKPFDLPGRRRRRFSEYDTTTFRSIWNAARSIENDCMLPTRRPGWESVGVKSNIGIFLWATDSEINEQAMGVGDGKGAIGLPDPSNLTDAGRLDSMLR